jgi:hypothetical protein
MLGKQTLLIITGKTKRQFGDELRVSEFVVEQGIKPPESKTCYLCRREEGEESVRVNVDENSVQLPRIELTLYRIGMGQEAVFGYWLCTECAILLSEFGTPESASD